MSQCCHYVFLCSAADGEQSTSSQQAMSRAFEAHDKILNKHTSSDEKYDKTKRDRDVYDELYKADHYKRRQLYKAAWNNRYKTQHFQRHGNRVFERHGDLTPHRHVYSHHRQQPYSILKPPYNERGDNSSDKEMSTHQHEGRL